MQLSSIICASVAALTFAAAAQAGAEPTLLVTDGILTGAKNVSVLGALYDVTFVDGSCRKEFNGCVEPFTFQDAEGATAAARALLDQVFVNSPAGDFDDYPDRIFGCTARNECNSFIPYAIDYSDGAAALAISIAVNGSLELQNYAYVRTGLTDDSIDFANIPLTNFARFQLASPVPEPAVISLMMLGLGFLAVVRRRKL